MENIENNLKNHIKINSTVIIGVSGGPDSVYLLIQCVKLTKTHPFKIVVAHINHKLRGKDSDLDEKFVKKLAKENSLKFELKTLKKIPAGNLEEQCRIARYSFFNLLLKKHKADWILTAHQRDDQIETVLFNLIRGSFLDGLKGMQLTEPNRKIFRPLINTSKAEILAFLKRKRIPFRIDKTNLQLNFSRNLLRNKAVPIIKKINSNFEETFIRNLNNIKEVSTFINLYAKNWLSVNSGTNTKTKKAVALNTELSLKKFLKLDPIIQKTVLAILYKQLNGNTNKFNQQHLEQILQILHNEKSNRKKEFGDKHFIAITNKNGERKIKFIKK